MNKDAISYQINDLNEILNPSLIAFANVETANNISKFHSSLPNYSPTPLVKLSRLASWLGIKELLIKDESHRFDLNAFKVLGASYAIAKYLGEILELKDVELTFGKILAKQSRYQNITFVTATGRQSWQELSLGRQNYLDVNLWYICQKALLQQD